MKIQPTNIVTEKMNLYENASLKRVIESFKENLSITHFDLVPKNKVSIKNFFSNTTDILSIKAIVLPEINYQNLNPYLDTYLVDMETRLNQFRSNTKLSLAEKIKTLAFLISECGQMEMQYYPFNQLLVFYNFEWRYENTPIPYSRLAIEKKDIELVRKEIMLRFEFFQFIKMKLELFKMRLEAEKPKTKLINWKKTKRPELIITEMVLALEEKGHIDYISDQAKTEFRSELVKIFSLKHFKWSEMVSEINKRQRLRYKILRNLIKDSD